MSDADRIRALEERLLALEHPQVSTTSSEAPAGAPISSATQGTSQPSTPATLTLAGYVESFYQWNFNNPSNGITNFRGFDNRHNTAALSNVVFDASGSLGPVTARLALQFGTTPQTYYLAEITHPGTAATGSSDLDAWKVIQQANVGWRAPVGRGLLLEAGIFLSPIGPEGVAVHDQWNWSRSNLFFGMPAYHAGVRAAYSLTGRWTVSLAGYNGWNSVIDGNAEKSVAVAADYVVTDVLTFHAMYFGGVERVTGAPERQGGTVPWRNLFDSYLALYPRPWLSLMVHGNAGFEPNAFGTSWWAAGALYARARPLSWLYLAVRGDIFYESVPGNALGTASAIFWPSAWVSSGTATVDFRPHDNISMRVEYRHDQAAGDTYFRGTVAVDPVSQAFVPNARSQDTLTLGVTAWF
ncbi:MAG: outer membrane beta-barrel protein [Deltaproteobacteria bacterium]